MTFDQVLDRPLTDLEDCVLAVVGFDFAKHGVPGYMAAHGVQEAAQEKLDAMTNSEFLSALSSGYSEAKQRNLL